MGSAQTILEANVLGGSCSRACPVEVLCEGACVLHRYNRQPIEIGRCSGCDGCVSCEGGAGAVCAGGRDRDEAGGADWGGAGDRWRVRRSCGGMGMAATIYDARELPGGLNTYGIAEYKLPLAESLREIDMIARLGVEFRFGRDGGCGHAGGAGGDA